MKNVNNLSKYLSKSIKWLFLVFCLVSFIQAQAKSVYAAESLVSHTGGIITKVTATVSNLDTSGNLYYKGVDLAIFQDEDMNGVYAVKNGKVTRVLTSNTSIEVPLGLLTDYLNNGSKYKVGYRVIYSPVGDDSSFLISDELNGKDGWKLIQESGSDIWFSRMLSQVAPIVPVASSITATTVVLTSTVGSQITTSNGVTKVSGSTWTVLSPITTYTAFAYLPADATHTQSPNSANASFTTVKLSQVAPATPVASNKTDRTVVLTSSAGSQITSNGTTKDSGSTWSSLTPGSAYTAVAFMTADTTHYQSPNSVTANYTMLKTDQVAPAAPSAIGVTSNSVVLVSSMGSQITCNGQTKASGSTWTGLAVVTGYSAFAYYPGDAANNQSPNSANTSFTTLKGDQLAPTTPVYSAVTTTTVVLTSSAGSQITCNGVTKVSGSTWTGLSVATDYSANAYYPANATLNQSPNSGSTSFTTLKLNQTAPTSPVASAITASSVVLTSSAGAQITCNGDTRASGSTWTGLNAATAYTAFAFKPIDSTHYQSPNSGETGFTTLKLDQEAPIAPSAIGITTSSVTLVSSMGAQITCNGVTKASSSTWTGLTPGTAYTANSFYSADGTHNQSPNSLDVNFTTLKADQVAPIVPVASSITATTVVLTSSAGSQITSNGVTQASGSTWTGLTPGLSYTALAFMPADATRNQSPNSTNANYTMLKLSQVAPSVPVASGITTTTVVLTSSAGSQITSNGVTKVSGSTWTGLTPGSAYTALAFMPADATHNQSPDSTNANYTMLKLSQVAPSVPVASGITTTTVILTSSAGSQITSNGETKVSGSTWSGLTPGSAYTALAFMPADATHNQSPNSTNANYTMLKLSQASPVVPVASGITTTTVVLTSSVGSQITSNGVTKVSGSTWSSLTPGSGYTAYAYFSADATHNQSPNSANANYTMLKLSQVAPIVPVASSITATTVVLTSTAGSQITSNGETKASGSTWSGLTVGTAYTAFAYMPADATHSQSPNSANANYTTLLYSQSAPAVPIYSGVTATTVILTSSMGAQITSNGVTKASGSTWTSLTPVTVYTAFSFYPADATHYQGANSANANYTTLKLDQAAPTVPIASGATTTTVILTSSAGSQITSNGETKASGSTWSGLSASATYSALAYMPADATHYQSPNSDEGSYTLLKLDQAAPITPVASGITTTTVVLTSSAGSQITSNGVTQASGSTWTGLTPGSAYTALAYLPVDATHNQSPNSTNANYTMLKLSQVAPVVPVASGITTTTVVLTSSAGSQITSNGVTQASGSTWTGLTPGSSYTAFAYLPVNATHNQSPNSANANYTMLKLSQVAPTVPVASSITTTTVVLTSSVGSQITSNGVTKVSGSTWTVLTPGSSYTAFAYMAADATRNQSPNSTNANYTMLKLSQVAPVVPVASSITTTTVVLTSSVGSQITSNGETKVSGSTWSSLTPGSSYTALAFMPADATHSQSPNSANANYTMLKLSQVAPIVPVASGITTTTVVLTSSAGSQITSNGVTQASGSTWTGLTPGSAYTALAFMPADATRNQSPNSANANYTMLKLSQVAPIVPVASGITTTTVVLTSSAGSQITSNGETKVSGSTWTGLTPGSAYTALAFMPADATHNQSPSSANANYTMLKLSQVAPSVPVASSITTTTVVLTSSVGSQITSNGETKVSGSTWSSLTPGSAYTALAFMPADATHYQSPSSANANYTMLKLSQVAPIVPVASGITDTTVVLTSSAGSQITSNGETKASGSTWTGLSAVTLYTAFAYFPSDATHSQSPNSSNANYTTLKSAQASPIVPVASGITTTTAVLTSSAGSQITSNGVTQASGSTWTGLTPGSAYTALAYLPADATHDQSPNSANANYTMLKLSQVAPTVPVASGITTTTVVLTSTVGSQITSNGVTKVSGSTWTGLTPGSAYTALAYLPADATHNQSTNSTNANYTMLKLSQVAPSVPVASGITTTTVVLTSSAGSQITSNGETKASGSTWSSLTPGSPYTALAYLPADATHNQSPNSANANYTMLKLSQVAPSVPVASSITDTTVVLTSSAGSQITSNGVTQASGSTWTGLTVTTAYTAFAYMSADATHNQSPNSANANYTTLKADQVAPIVPVASGITTTTVVLTSSAGSQITSNGVTQASGSTWTGLTPGSVYTAFAYLPADATHNQSPNSANANYTMLKLSQVAPSVPAASSITTTTVVLTSSVGSQITSNGVTQASGSTWTGLTPGSAYTALAYLPADATHNQSPSSANANYTMLKLSQVAPIVPVASSITTTTVVLTSSVGSQITSNGVTQASGSTWTGLTPGSAYTALAFMPADATRNQSPNSTNANYTMLKLSQVAPVVPVASSITTTTVILTSSVGSQITSNGETKVSGSTWSSLTPGSSYTALAFMPADATHNQSPSSANANYTMLKLSQVAPTVPVASSITTTTVVLTSSVGSQITSNGEAKVSGSTWSSLTPGSSYTALAFMPADATHNQSTNSANANYAMLKLSQVAPTVPVASSITTTTVILTSSVGSQITSNGETKVSGSTWSSLTPGSSYTALAFMPADATHNQSPSSANANYTMLKLSQVAPIVPVASGITTTTVVLTSSAGSQITSNGVTQASGSTWTGLTPGSAYTALAFMPADATRNQSPNSANANYTMLKLSQVAPIVPVASGITTTTVVLTSSAGSQITSNGETQASGSTWTGLTPGAAYTALAFMPADATHNQSPSSANANYTMLKLSQVAPTVPVASSITTTTVVLTSSVGSQITSNGETKASGSTWTGLTPGAAYTALAFMPADATHNQSPSSANANYTILKLSQVAPTVPVASSITTTTVVLTSSVGSQITSNGETKASGSTWSGLTVATAYMAFAYMPVDATHNQSPNSTNANYTTLKLSQVAPSVPVASSITTTTVVLTSSVGSQITSNGETKVSGSTWSSLTPGSTYTALAFMPADATHYQSPSSANANYTMLKLSQVAPTVPVASSITTTTVVLTSTVGSQITSNGVTQASGSTWSSLTPGSTYTAFAFMPSDATRNQSPNSANANYTMLKLSQVAPIVPVASGISATTVVLTSSMGSLITSNGVTQASGSTWSSLTPGTAYTALAYYPSDATHYQSANSANANFTTIKADQVAPSVPVASSITTTTVVLTSSAGSQITSNGVSQASGSTWSGLTPGSGYTAFAFMPADATRNQSPNSANANYTMLKLSQVAPIVPVASSITTTTVVLTSSAGSQITSNGVTKVSGSTWSSLTPGSGYTAFAYLPADATHNQSPNSANANYTMLKLSQVAPSVPVASSITTTTVVLTSSAGSQITSNGVTQASGSTWTGLTPGTSYTALAYLQADATHSQSPNSANANYTMLKLSQVAPIVPVVSSITTTTVVLTSSAGSQITSNGETKASGSTWSGLTPGSAYTAFAYLPADATHYQSPNSANANYTMLNPTVTKPVLTSLTGTAPIGDPNPTFTPTTTIKVDFSTTGIIDTATIYLKQSGQLDKALGTVAVVSDGSGNASVSQQLVLPSTAVVNLAANVYVRGTNTSISMTVTSLDSNSFTPNNPIVITPTINGPSVSAILTGAGYSGYYPGKVIQVGSGTDGFVSALKSADPGGSSATFSTQVNPAGYWRNTWPANGSPQNFTISASSTWDANYTVTMTGNTPFIDTTTGLSQTATGTKTFKLDPKLTISGATATAVASVNQVDGKIHPSYPDHAHVSNTVKLDATTTGFSNGMIATVYSPSMAVLGTVTLNVSSGNNLNTTTWTNTWAVPENLTTGVYTFRFTSTAHDGQPSVTRDATGTAVRDIAVTAVSNTIPVATAWMYPSAQPTNQVYPGQVINLSANTIGEAQSVGVRGSDGTNGPAMTTTDKTLYSSTWSSTFTIPITRKIGETYTLTFTGTDKFGATNTRTLVLTIRNPLGSVPSSISVTPYDVGQGPNPAPTAKLKVTMQLYGWVTTAKINWPAPNAGQVTLIKTAGPDARGITTWSTDSNGIVVPHDVACGYPNSPVAPVSSPINLNLTVTGSSSFTNADNSSNSFSDSTTNVPISDNVTITSFTTSVDYANIGDTIQLTAITTGFAEAVSVQFPWDATPVVLVNSFGLPSPFQAIWTANYTIPVTAIPAPGSPYTITATATNTFNVKPPAGSTEIAIATTPLTISSLTLDMFGPATAHRGDTLTLWGNTTGRATSVKLISVSPSIPYSGSGTLVNSLDFISLSDPATSEANTWYSDQSHANGWKVPDDIGDETILTFTYEATDALGLKKQDTLQVRITPIVVVIDH